MAARKPEGASPLHASSPSKCRRKRPRPSEPNAEAGLPAGISVLQAAEEWQRTFDAVPEPIAVLDLQHRIVRLNKNMAERLGLAKDQCVGQTCYRLIHGTDEPPSFCPHSQLLQDGEEHTAEVGENRLGGEFRVSVSPLRDSTGKLIGCVHLARDVTDCKRAEASLKSACAMLQSLWSVTSLPDTSVKSVANHILASITQMAESPYGFYGFLNEDESVMTIHAWSGDATRDCSMVDKPQHFPIGEAGIWGDAIRHRAPVILNDYTAVHTGKKGLPQGHVPVSRLLVVPHFSHGRMFAVAAVANRPADYTQDDVAQITSFLAGIDAFVQSALARESLRESEERLRLAHRATNDVVWDWDVRNDTQRWNESGTVVFGWTEIVEGPVNAAWWVERVHPDDRQRVDDGFFAVVNDPQVEYWECEYRFLKADGNYADVIDRGYVLRDKQGKAIRMIGAMRDVSDRKQAEEDLQRSQRLQAEAKKLAATGRMAARVAHEINNPLAGIQNAFQLIRNAVPETHPDHDMVERIDREIRRIADLVRQLYTLYSPQKAEQRVEVVVADTIDDVLVMLEPLRREHGVRFDVDEVHRGLTVRMPRGGLHQIMYNLVANAVEASPRGGTVALATRLLTDEGKPGLLRISIGDQGEGIPPEFRHQIYEPLFTMKADNGLRGGLGLGLPLVKCIVESVGGGVDFQSTPGHGTVFRVSLPQGLQRQEQ